MSRSYPNSALPENDCNILQRLTYGATGVAECPSPKGDMMYLLAIAASELGSKPSS